MSFRKTEKHKILHIMHSKQCGGAERHVVILVTQLMKLGYDVAVACPKKSWLAANLPKDIRQHPIRMRGFFDLLSLIKLTFVIGKYDLVHAHLQRSSHYAKLACKIINKPSVYTAHASNAHKHFPDGADIIAVSNAVKSALPESRFNSVQVVHNGVMDMSVSHSKAELRSRYNIKADQIAICMIARIVPVKGHDVLINALLLLRDLDIKVFFAGDTNTSCAAELQEVIQKHKLPVVFLGHIEQPELLLGAMDFLVAPSRREAISLTILEACSAKIPSIGSNIDGIPEAIDDGKTGYLFSEGSHVALADRIRELSLNGDLAQLFGEAARKKYLSQFTESIMAKNTGKVYEKLLSQ